MDMCLFETDSSACLSETVTFSTACSLGDTSALKPDRTFSFFVMRSVTTQVWVLQNDKLWFQTGVLGLFVTTWVSFVCLVRKVFSEVEKLCFKRFSSCELWSNSQLVWKQSILTHGGEPHYSIMHFSQLLTFAIHPWFWWLIQADKYSKEPYKESNSPWSFGITSSSLLWKYSPVQKHYSLIVGCKKMTHSALLSLNKIIEINDRPRINTSTPTYILPVKSFE